MNSSRTYVAVGLIAACIARGTDRLNGIYSEIGNLLSHHEIKLILDRGTGATGKRRVWWLMPNGRYVLRDDVSDLFTQ